MEKNIRKEFAVSLKSFTYLAYIIIAFSMFYAGNAYFALSAKGEPPEKAFTYGIIALIIAAFFLFMGNKKRRFVFFEDYFEYKTNKVLFSEKYENISFLHIFKEKGKESVNVFFSTNAGEEHKISSAFLGYDVVKGIFEELYENCKNNEDFEVEDEIGWLSGGN